MFVSEECCPFCAAERWPLAVALSHFGTWSHLGATQSSATDVFPNTATLSFRTASYRSSHLTLRTTELTGNRGHRLQPLTPLDTTLTHGYDVRPRKHVGRRSLLATPSGRAERPNLGSLAHWSDLRQLACITAGLRAELIFLNGDGL